ncbi:hypothetical protein [Sphaerisporangium corydalis]|uniref:AAA+ ATPase domain-containing protein n=1 Tax=Sphaerisporangium corydalis TaxID=1441875 RepID=A0ABV9ERZ2_9ACTN|nr:hypothetical protein [Sphaerisporangium corydalis]
MPATLPAEGVDPADVHTAAELAAALKALVGDRSYSEVDRAVRGYGRLPKSTLGEAVNLGRPSENTLELILRACAVPREQWPGWKAAWERAHAEVPPGLAGLIRVEQADPRRLGVHAPIDAPQAVGDLPVYVSRDTDSDPRGIRALIGQAAERGGLVVLVGDSSVGKTRCAYEAIRALVPQWWLLHPADAEQVRQAAAVAPHQLVVWLDELQKFMGGPAGLTADTIRALLSGGSILISTIWPRRYDAYVALPQDSDPYAREREVLGLADIVHLGSRFSSSELERAQDAAQAGDRRIALALQSSDYGLTQVIAAAPQLIDRWRSADLYAAAILNAAIDATRIGVRSSLGTNLLRDAAPGYCDARQGHVQRSGV